MKVFSMLSDKGGSAFYRVSEPSRIAGLHGVEVGCDEELSVVAEPHPDGTFDVLEITQDCDVLMMQRPLTQIHHSVAVAAHRQGIPLVVDLDDDFHNVHHKNVAVDATSRRRSPLENTRWLIKSLRLATVITVSTPALLKYEVEGTKAVVVRNRLPEAILTLPRRSLGNSIGWTGSVSTHPEDLQQARGVLDLIETPLAIVGHIEGVAETLQLPPARVYHAATWVNPVSVYWRALNGSFDVGICPLETSAFNRAKSALKPMEYMALGKPFIASPLPEYKRLVEESGAGILAVGPRRWAQAARDLLEDGDDYRKRGAEWSRENVLEKHIGEWIAAWELALERKKR